MEGCLGHEQPRARDGQAERNGVRAFMRSCVRWCCPPTTLTYGVMSLKVPSDKPWEAEHAADWDKITVKDWLDRSGWTQCVLSRGKQNNSTMK